MGGGGVSGYWSEEVIGAGLRGSLVCGKLRAI